MAERRWHILGAGAIGCLFASKLQAAGLPVTLITREQPAAAQGRVSVESATGITHSPVRLVGSRDPGPIDLLVVTTKAAQLVEALSRVAGRLSAGAQVVLAANGLGYLEQAQAVAGNCQLFTCTTTEGAYRTGSLRIHHAGSGTTLFGRPGGGPAAHWFSDWATTSLQCEWLDPIEPALWHKLAINCAINPLTALAGCRNGELLSQPALREQLEALCDEIAAVSLAADFPGTARSIHHDARQVASATAANRSSMLQDRLAGRATEIDYITGHLLREARRLGIDTPLNAALWQQVKALDTTPDSGE